MRESVPERLERSRVIEGRLATSPRDGFLGCFIMAGPCGAQLRIIASAGDSREADGWEHVSVSIANRVPNWIEMCFVKDLFWSDDECVVQFHPPRADYVNNHPHCLHMWKSAKAEFPRPPSWMVGVKNIDNPTQEEARAMSAWLGNQ